jgi:two-component system, sensor histidine kinase and response regulator
MNRVLLHLLIAAWLPTNLYAQSGTIDSLRTHINPAIAEPETVTSIIELTSLLIQEGRADEAREWLRLGFEAAERAEYTAGKFSVLYHFGNFYLVQNKPDSASVMLLQAELYASTPAERNELYNLRANTYKQEGKPVLALEQLERAVALSDSLGDRNRFANLQVLMGNAFSSLGDHTEALRAYYNALEFAEQHRDSAFMASANNLVGWKFQEMDNPDQAEYFLHRAEVVSREIGDIETLQSVLMNLGILYTEKRDFTGAEEFFNESLRIANESGNKAAQIRIFYNLGLMESRRGNIAEARRLLMYALEESRSEEIVDSEFYSATGLGQLELDLGNTVQAIRWFARANQVVDSDRYNTLRLQSFGNLYRAYREAGNFSESLRWLEQRNELNDSLNTTEKARLLAEYETLFNMKRTEQQAEVLRAREEQAQAQLRLQRTFIIFALSGGGILLVTALFLVRANTKRKEMNMELQKSNQQLNDMNSTVQEQNKELEQINDIKNKLFAIIAHDLRGPLSSLQSLLYLIRDHELSKSEMEEISKTLERNLQENASMMDNLLAWAQAQMNGIKLIERDFPLYQAVKSVVDQIKFQAEKKGVVVEMVVATEIEVNADYDMIKLVVRNLTANAIKFSERGDKITIKADEDRENGMSEIRIIDEGVGIKEEDQAKLLSNEHYTKRGTDNEKGSGLGLMLCKEFVESHGGKMWFESKYGEGTTFIFTIPLVAEAHNSDGEGNREPILEKQR